MTRVHALSHPASEFGHHLWTQSMYPPPAPLPSPPLKGEGAGGLDFVFVRGQSIGRARS
jgi:hypothetical protein